MSIDNNTNIANKSEVIDNDDNNKGDDIFSRNPLEAINWNQIEDQTDKDVFDRLVSNFWVPEKIPVANDQKSWANLTEDERNATMKVFTGLTLLDTIQGDIGAVSLLPDARSLHERAVYANIHFMETIHAKSYSNIFMTLSNTPEINEAFRWSRENSNLQYKAHTIVDLYEGDDPLKRKIASVLLESFLFYSGFYLPFRFSSMGRLTNTADVIRLIVRDESIHGYYIGYRYQVSANRLTEEQREEYKDFTIGVLLDLYENECAYAEEIYDPLGWTEDVKKFMRYNANKALNNLGFDPLFPADTTRVSPSVLSSMSSNADENHDFFSGAGSSYIIGDVEETSDDDWDF